ncbi:MAG: 23S rRNA (adenine(2503)-C(2))-methyltransferase RlmN [Anaerolineae bacterium]|nr:23S rRNA (adenine(2503)-C(2))-methyltransferase RlmN [Anaerolineae bacterium]
MTELINLYTLTQPELAELLAQWNLPRFRAKQVWAWLYDNAVGSFDEMTDLPTNLRERLKAEATLGTLTTHAERSSKDGTLKRLYALPDSQLIESVLMPYDDHRRTACISTQAGCAMGCTFCATGQMGFARHLSAAEIVEQAVRFAQILRAEGDRLSNVVLMGMGEPFHNYDASVEAIRRLMSDLGIGARHITVSTVGLVPQILRFADEGLQVKLAISLHAATDDERATLLPINKRYPLADLLDACRTYIEKTGRRVTFEWASIAGKNDTAEQAHTLGELLQGVLAHVNLIPLNPTGGYDGRPSDPEATKRFIEILGGYGVSATVRVRRGIDIDAGCGQLKASVVRRQRAADTVLPSDIG